MKQLESGRVELAEKKADAEVQFADAEEELNSGEQEYLDGVAEFEKARAEVQEELDDAAQELADGEEDLADGQKKLEELKEADCYVLGRDTNVGYVCFESDTNIVEAISGVFPLFFFLVAALVCITTMTRMVDDERTKIGVLKALGYHNSSIMAKYLFYSGSASLLGCVFGFLFVRWVLRIVLF